MRLGSPSASIDFLNNPPFPPSISLPLWVPLSSLSCGSTSFFFLYGVLLLPRLIVVLFLVFVHAFSPLSPSSLEGPPFLMQNFSPYRDPPLELFSPIVVSSSSNPFLTYSLLNVLLNPSEVISRSLLPFVLAQLS